MARLNLKKKNVKWSASLEPQKEMRALVSGHVQGVGFRMITLHFASRLNLVGTVQNQADGSVEIIAQGTKENLEQLIVMLQQHFGENIDEMETVFFPIKTPFQNFRIKNT